LRRKEQKRGAVMDGLQPPFPIPSRHLGWGGRGVGDEGLQLSLGRRLGGKVF